MRGSITVILALLPWLTGCSGEPTGLEISPERVFDDHREIDIRFENGPASLSGTLFLPIGEGPFSVAVVNEGSGWTTRSGWDVIGPFASAFGAVFTFDKRSYGESTGECCALPDDELFPLLAGDAVAAARALQSIDDIDPDRIGLFGSSFSGWTVPLAANMDRNAISFLIVTVGGAVSVGQEMAYDVITGYESCTPTGITAAAASDSIETLGTSGWDPMPSLRELAQPSLWIFGGNDLSHPTHLSVRNLESVMAAISKPWTISVFPDANHDLISGGGICQTEGPVANVLPVISDFIADLN